MHTIHANLTADDGTGFLTLGFFAVVKWFETEKLLNNFVFSTTISLKFLAFYMSITYEMVPYEKHMCCLMLHRIVSYCIVLYFVATLCVAICCHILQSEISYSIQIVSSSH